MYLIHLFKTVHQVFAPSYSSDRIKRSLYTFFEPINTNWNEIQKIVLLKNNKTHFIDAINRSKEEYIKEVVKEVKRNIEDIPNWNVPKIIEYTKLHKKREYKKCVVFPMYVKTFVKNEAEFMDFIDKSDGIKWWFKNGENDKKYFAIQYINPDDGLPHSFYVDFIIRMNDGRVGLFDTKQGDTAKAAKTQGRGVNQIHQI